MTTIWLWYHVPNRKITNHSEPKFWTYTHGERTSASLSKGSAVVQSRTPDQGLVQIFMQLKTF